MKCLIVLFCLVTGIPFNFICKTWSSALISFECDDTYSNLLLSINLQRLKKKNNNTHIHQNKQTNKPEQCNCNILQKEWRLAVSEFFNYVESHPNGLPLKSHALASKQNNALILKTSKKDCVGWYLI